MNRLFPRSSHSNLRVFFACLLSFMTMIAPIASVAASTRRNEPVAASKSAEDKSKLTADEKLDSYLFAHPLAAPVATPDITATKAATFADSDADSKAELGETITYNVNVGNAGPGDATNVTFTDTVDPNTTFVPGSLKVSPLAFADTYITPKNTVLNVGAPGVLGNDTGTATLAVSQLNGSPTLTGSTTGGGTVTIFADGHFDYTPNATFEGADTFTYTVTNGQSPDDTATVTINVDAAPTVTATSPVNGATNAATSGNITVTFSESVSATANAFSIQCPTGTPITFTQSASPSTTFTLDPTANLPSGVTCTVTVDKDEISDTDAFDPPDNMAADYTFSFSTDAAPEVTTTTPTNGAPSVAANTNITVNFSEPVTANTSAFTLECPTGTGKTFTLSGSGTSSLVLDPTADLPFGTLCTVTVIGANIHDLDANDPPDTMVGNVAFSFTIDSQPTVTGTTPTNGATNVAGNANITVTFSENVNVTASAFTIQCPVGSPVTYTLTPAAPGATNVFTLDPTTDLPGGVTCTVTVVANQVTDTDSFDPPDAMAANYVFSFTVDAAPFVTSVTPVNLATNVAANTDIVVNFSESVNVTASSFTLECPVGTPTAFTLTPAVPGPASSYTLNPNADLPFGVTCTVTVVATQVTDADANDPPDQMVSNYVFTFTVDSPPAVSSTTPTNGATGVAANTNITVVFNEPVNVTTNTFTIKCPASSSAQPYGLSGSGTATIVLNPTSDLPIGAECTVTVLKDEVADVDSGDPPDHLLADYVFTFKIPPVANSDTYPDTIVGNVQINSANRTPAYSVTANDTFTETITINKVQAVTAVVGNTITATTTKGGTVVMIVSGVDVGKFTYNPPAGYEGTGANADTFTYEITNNGGTSNAATVSLPISGMVWFINNNSPSCTTIAAGCGRLTNPFSDLGSFDGVNGDADVPASNIYNPAVNDNIFIYQSATAYNNGVVLFNGQKLIGQDSTSSLSTLTGLTPPSGSLSFPTMFPADGTITKITTASGPGITLNSAAGSNVVNGLTVGNTAGAGILGTTFGTVTIADVNINEPASAGTRTGQALSLITGAVTATFGNVTSISASPSGTTNVTLSGVTGTINLGTGALALTTGTGNSLNLSGTAAIPNTATISYAGTINNTVGRAINVSTKSSGTVTFTGAITSSGSGSGVFIDTSVTSTATYNFMGGVNLNTGTNDAFTVKTTSPAASGGTVNVCDENPCNPGATGALVNTLTTTTGSALNVANTTIGANNLEFRSINSNGGSSAGIILNNTGATGALLVKGTGSAGSGGTIANKSGANAWSVAGGVPTLNGTTVGVGVYMNNTRGTSLSFMQLNDFSNAAISSFASSNFTLTSSVISGVNGNDGAADEGSVFFFNLSGTAAITSCNISGAWEDNVRVLNNTGTLNRITITGTTIGTNSVTDGNNGIGFEATGSAVLNATVTGGTFTSTRADWVNATTQTGATMDVDILNNNFSNNHTNIAGGGSRVIVASNGNTTYTITGNTLRDSDGSAIFVNAANSAALLSGTIESNTIGVVAVANSGSKTSSGIALESNGGGDHTSLVKNNIIRQHNNHGINMTIGTQNGQPTNINFTVQGNTVTNPGTINNDFNAIHLNNGTAPLENFTSCVDIGGAGALVNNVSAGADGASASLPNTADIRLRQRQSTTVRLPGYAGANNDNTAVQNYLRARNTTRPDPDGAQASNTVPTGGGFTGGAACVQPTTMYKPEGIFQRDYLARTNKAPQAAEQLKNAPAANFIAASGSESFTAHSTTTATTQPAAQQQAVQTVAAVRSSKTSEIVKTAKAQPMAQPLSSRSDAEVFTGHAQARTKAQPAANSFLNAAMSPVAPDITQLIGTIPSGKTVTISFQVTVKTAATFTGTSPQVSNQGTVTADDPNGGTITVLTDDTSVGGANNPTVTPVDSQPDLQITKTDGAVVAVPGGTISYTLAYNNTNGKRDANNTVITETIPANTVFNAGASDASWSCPGGITAGNTCTLAVSSIPAGGAGGSAIFAVTVVNPLPAGVTGISNTATIADDGLFGVDGNPTNNTSTVLTSLTAAINLSIVKSDGNSGSTPGQNITYTLTYANIGNKGATGVVINETVPANTTFNAGASTAGWSCAANTAGSACTFPVGALPGGGAGSAVTFVVTVDNPVPGGTTQISNTATITDDGTNGADADGANNTSTDTTPFDAPPTIGTYSDTSLFVTQGTTVSPTAPPADDKPGFTVGVAAPGFTGGLSVNQTTGVVTITNAGPAAAGAYTVTVTVTDSIGQTAVRTFQLTVSKSDTTTTVTSSSPTLYVGQSVTYTATVTSNTAVTGPPTGTVNFFDGGNPIPGCNGVTVNGSGQATCSQTYTNTVGSPHSITATYSGDVAFNTSTSSALSQTVSPSLNLIVNTLGDAADLTLNGVCDTDAGTVGDQCTLRAAIQETNFVPTPDTIGFSLPPSSTITLNAALDAINGNVTINGPGANLLTVRRDAAAATQFRIFTISSSTTVNISDLTVSNGNGGISNTGTLTLTGVIVSGNTSVSSGGGISTLIPGKLTLLNSTISGNTSTIGGGLYNDHATVIITNSTISGNTATGSGSSRGGGIFNTIFSDLTITGSTISDNTSVNGGGGIQNEAFLTVMNSTISGNRAATDGGGLNNAGFSNTAVLTNVTITNNRADSDGNASGAGGGIANTNTNTLTLRNTIVAGNFRGASPGTTADDVSGPVASSSANNLIGSDTGLSGITNGSNANQIGTSFAPIDPRLGPLANNGGPTQTHALLAGSPALDAGDDSVTGPPLNLTTDQRGAGFARQVDGPDADTTATVDIGAFEAQVSISNILDTTTNEDTNAVINFTASSNVTNASISVTSSNTTLVPNANIVVGGASSPFSLTITPAANLFGTTTITVTVTVGGQTMSDDFVLTVAPVPDQPSVTNGSTSEDTLTPPGQLVISRNAVDGAEVSHFQITGITGGTLYQNDGTTQIVNGQFITFAQGNAGLRFLPAPNSVANGSFTVQAATGNVFAAGPTATATITVSSVNDQPTLDAITPNPLNILEDAGVQNVSLSGITAGGGESQTLVVTATSNNTGLIPNPTVTYTSPNTTGSISFTPVANASGTADITVTVNDGGGGTQTVSRTFTVNVTAVNDVPSFTKGPDQTVNEDAGAQTVNPWATAISAGTGDTGQTVNFQVTNNTNAALFTVQPAVSSTGVLTYTPAANSSGTAAITIVLKDNGGTANGGVDTSAPQTFNITVNAVNDAPVNTVPAAQNVDKNGSLTFSAGNGNAISIADTDAGSNPVRVTLTATNGNITLNGTTGLSFTVGDGTSDATMTFTGTITNINNALNGLVFNPTNGFDGLATLQITTNDQGNSGSGGALSDTDTINISVVQGGILIFSSATYTVNEAAGTATITVNRTSASNGTTTVNYATSNGTATAGQDYTATSGQLTFNNGETTKTFTVSITNDALNEANETINLTLSNVTGSGDIGSPSTAVLTITDDDPQPSLSINDATVNEGNSGTTNATFTVTLSAVSGQNVTVNYQTANGTASAPSDYTAIPSTVLTFLPGETTKTITVLVKGDTDAEANETFFVNLSGAVNASISDGQGLGTITSDDTPLIGLSSSTYSVTEDGLHATITVNRLGDLSQAARVDYLTSDPSGLNLCSQLTGNASSRCDYATTAGTLRFAAGETSKTIFIPIVDDVYLDGPEVFTLTLSNSVGGDISGINAATITITDNDTAPAANPIENDAFFIRQLYIDFLGREPEPGAVTAWLGILNHCAIPTDCDRIAVARGFVRSQEFQERGYFVYRTFKTLGRIAHYNEFIPDMARVSGFLSAQDLEANKDAYILMFMDRQEFKNLYDSTIGNPTAYVDKLLQEVELTTHPSRAAWIAGLTNGTLTRAQVLRQLIDSGQLYTLYVNEAFIIMNYFGFLRRDADASYLTWIDIFNHTNDDRLIISGFINSPEYRLRFGPN